jgi:immunity protein 50 of polymorphic toxin system
MMKRHQVAPVPIGNARGPLSAFGYWPSFHDAEVHRVELNRGAAGEHPSITLVVHVFDMSNEVDENGQYRVVTSVLTTLRFDDVRESELLDLGPQNVLSSLVFELETTGLIRVTLGPCYGLFGSLVCGQVTVLSVVPWRSPTEDAPPVRNSRVD